MRWVVPKVGGADNRPVLILMGCFLSRHTWNLQILMPLKLPIVGKPQALITTTFLNKVNLICLRTFICYR